MVRNRCNCSKKYLSFSTFQKKKKKIANHIIRSSRLEAFLVKGVLKICSKLTGEHPCRSVISIKLLCNFQNTFSIKLLPEHHFNKVALQLPQHLFLGTPLGGCFCIMRPSQFMSTSFKFNIYIFNLI